MRKLGIRIAKAAGILLVVVGVLGAAAGFWLHSRLVASLPALDGEHSLPGLASPVEIERDELGVPTLRAANRRDLARATGWLHAQERFTQMDLMRRQAAGELAELLGPALLATDRRNRRHQFRRRSEAALAGGDEELRQLMIAYAEGINSGLAALGGPPPEYLALRAEPAPWRPEDSTLVLMGMYLLLQGDNGWHESALGLMHDRMPPELFEFLAPEGTEWDAPLLGGPLAMAPIPGVDALRGDGPEPRGTDRPSAEELGEGAAGSNSWAVSGAHTADGGALLANDMHLPLGMPNIWYRASLVLGEADSAGEFQRVTGVMLPGALAVVAGSNGHVAWGFTNAYVDTHDLVVLETDPEDDDRYLTPDGYREIERQLERILVKGEEAETLEVPTTIWGPLIDRDHRGRRRALRWVAHDAEAVNLDLVRMERARNVDEALDIARGCGIPVQNLIVADDSGRIGWTLAGMLPRRKGHDGMLPSSWADGSRGWDGWLTPEEYPVVLDPEAGRLWTANNRVVDAATLPTVGRRGYMPGARARQIRDGLLALEGATPDDMLAIQLDDRALFLERWRELLLRTLTPAATEADPRRDELRRVVEESWTGRASVDSAAYRLVRAFRSFLADQVFAAIVDPWIPEEARFDLTGPVPQWEGPLWALVTERPPHLLDSRFTDWEEQLLAAVDEVLDYYEEHYETGLADRTWGERNLVKIEHPLSRAVPRLAGWLDIEPRPLPGDSSTPRVQMPRFGASERFAVSPGREEQGYFHMPGGQSGHPMSRFYRAGHEAWAEGRPAPFLPGPPVHRLTLLP